ncbi:MAG: SPOR domain-containing protein [Hyphomicrobiaceae bacterium]
MSHHDRRGLLFAASLFAAGAGVLSAPADVAAREPKKPAPAAKPTAKAKPAAASALQAGLKALKAGKNVQAISAFNQALAGGALPPADLARALYSRGVAYRRTGKSAQAISDLTSALWIKGGLTEGDRKAAIAVRAEAYKAVGLKGEGDPEVVRSAPAARPAVTPAGWQTEFNGSGRPATPQPARAPAPAAQPSGSGTTISRFFGGIFGSTQPQPGPTTSSITPRPAPRPVPPAVPKAGDWGRSTEIKPVATKQARLIEERKPIAKGRAVHEAQIATLRSPGEAQALASRIQARHKRLLGTMQPSIGQTVLGNMGTFYTVKIGPFASRTKVAQFCSKIKSAGDSIDCFPIGK